MKKEIAICIEIGQLCFIKMHNGEEKKVIFKNVTGLKNFKRIIQTCNYSIKFFSNKIQLIDLDSEMLYSLKVAYIY